MNSIDSGGPAVFGKGESVALFGDFPRFRGGDIAGVAHDRIEMCLRYMKDHLNQPLQVTTLAALVNISPSHLFALFKRRTGRAPIDLFIRLRMQRACELIETTSASVKEVAAALGYEDPFYFSRVFKSVNQVSPSAYRRRFSQATVGERSPHSKAETVPANRNHVCATALAQTAMRSSAL